MRIIFLGLALLLGQVAHAAPITIDLSSEAAAAAQGFEFSATAPGSIINVGSGEVSLQAPPPNGGNLILSSTVDDTFGLDGLAIGCLDEPCQFGAITAYDEFDQMMASLSLVGLSRIDNQYFIPLSFDNSWTDISSIEFEPTGYGFFAGVSIRDIQVNVVPIPAAIWLFGSALAGLGWLRRK